MPSRTDRVTLPGGFHTTIRTVAMLQEARRLFTARTGKPGPVIRQGGYNKGGVKASKGTHDRDAIDLRSNNLSDRECRILEECLWTVGFAAWWRHPIPGLWPEHHHCIPKGGDVSVGATFQIWAFNKKRNGLKSDLKYPRIGKYAYATWEKYLAAHPLPKPAPPKPKPIKHFRLSDFKGAVKVAGYNRSYPSHVAVCQTALQSLGYQPGPVDGIKGKQTIAAMNQFLAKWGWSAASGRILNFQMLDRLIWEAEKLHPGTGYPPRAEK